MASESWKSVSKPYWDFSLSKPWVRIDYEMQDPDLTECPDYPTGYCYLYRGEPWIGGECKTEGGGQMTPPDNLGPTYVLFDGDPGDEVTLKLAKFDRRDVTVVDSYPDEVVAGTIPPTPTPTMIANADFEGDGGWNIERNGPSGYKPHATIKSTNSYKGTYCAEITNVTGSSGNPRSAYTRQTVNLPSDAKKLVCFVATDGDNYGAHRGIRINNTDLDSWSRSTSFGYTRKEYDITNFAGGTITIELFLEDLSQYAGFHDHDAWIRFDNFDILTTAAPTPTPTCGDHYNQSDCEAAGCYWWSDGTCHAEEEGECTSVFDHFADRTDEGQVVEGHGSRIFDHRVKNNGDAEGEVTIEIAELNAESTIKESLCRKSITIPAGQCAMMPYGPPDTCEIDSIKKCWRKYTSCTAEGKPVGTYYFGIKTWGEDEDEPAFTEADSKPDKVKVVDVTVVPRVECDSSTEHYSSGCELLLAYDEDGDGVINASEYQSAWQDKFNGVITHREFLFIAQAYDEGSINAVCPGCYSAPAPEPVGDITGVDVDSKEAPEGGTIDWTVNKTATLKVYFKNTGSSAGSFTITVTDEDDVELCSVDTESIPADGNEYYVTCGSFTPDEVETKTLTAHIDP